MGKRQSEQDTNGSTSIVKGKDKVVVVVVVVVVLNEVPRREDVLGEWMYSSTRT
jgi:hypothetical protein